MNTAVRLARTPSAVSHLSPGPYAQRLIEDVRPLLRSIAG
jgi:hypothetical protein